MVKTTWRFSILAAVLVGLVLILDGKNPGGEAIQAAPGIYLVYEPIIRDKPTKTVDIAYGIVFISSAEAPADALQYQNALSLNPEWNRYPLYWNLVETAAGVFNWSTQDVVVQGDVTYNLKTNAILLGTPGFYQTAVPERLPDLPQPPGGIRLERPQTGTPQGLYAPIFNDGTDVPGPGKNINPVNVWARFVFTAVNRYKPGGVLAQANGWQAGVGVTHWEMWNEPDLPSFWDGTTADYARLLKVGFFAARQADSQAKVLFGGIANHPSNFNYYRDVLNIYSGDTLAQDYLYLHDIFATHSYSYSENSWFHVNRAKNTMRDFGFSKPVWLNESGVPAWNDYPGPVWDPNSGYRGTSLEQADYLLQSTFFAVYAGAETIFHFQLYDGCGNQPQGTNFPPHNGELCDENGNLITNPAFPCAGDANGLFSNPSDAICFSQHPQPESARPKAATYQMLVTLLDKVAPYWWVRTGGPNPNAPTMNWTAFYREESGERIVGMWALVAEAQTAELAATSGSATLYYPDGTSVGITAVDGVYTINLPGATNQNAPWDPNLFMIGGRPVILVESDLLRAGAPVGEGIINN